MSTKSTTDVGPKSRYFDYLEDKHYLCFSSNVDMFDVFFLCIVCLNVYRHGSILIDVYRHGSILVDVYRHGSILVDVYRHGSILVDVYRHGSILVDVYRHGSILVDVCLQTR